MATTEQTTLSEATVTDGLSQTGTPAADPAENNLSTTEPADAGAGEDAETIEPDGVGTNKAGREAAKYRTQLRAVEAERDTLTAQLGAAREAIVNSHLSGQQISLKVAGIKKLGYSADDLLNDDLSLNQDALAATLQGIQDNGFSYKQGNGVVSKSGTGQGSPLSAGLNWGNAISGGNN